MPPPTAPPARTRTRGRDRSISASSCEGKQGSQIRGALRQLQQIRQDLTEHPFLTRSSAGHPYAADHTYEANLQLQLSQYQLDQPHQQRNLVMPFIMQGAPVNQAQLDYVSATLSAAGIPVVHNLLHRSRP